MRWQFCSPILITLLVTLILCSLTQIDGKKIRRRRQYLNNNYGSYALDPAVASYYGSSGGGSYTGNNQQNNRLIIGGVAYQYPTPVNVFSGGSYNPQEYNAYPPGSDGYYYPNLNNMRLPSPNGWYSGYYFYRYPFPPFFNSAQRCGPMSTMLKLVFSIFIYIFSISIL